MSLNIVHFICHDLGRDLGCYGNKTIPSPHLDRFAAEGVRFASFFAASTPCSPSRGCIMTGKYAHSSGLIGLVNRGWDLTGDQKTIVDCLNAAGYHTALIGLQHERKEAAKYRYAYRWQESNDAHAVAGHVAGFLENAEGPFYINAGTFEVHLRFDKPEYIPDDPDSIELPPYLVDSPETRLERARFHGAIRYMDEAFAKILEAVDRTGHRDDTIVVFTTDHGAAFPRAKSTLYDPGIGTALIMRVPGAAPVVCNDLLSNIDLLPTLLDAAGMEVPTDVQGRSFHPLVVGGEYKPRDHVFSEKNFHDHYDPVRCVRTNRYKYIRSFTEGPMLPLPKDIRESIASKALPPDANAPRPPEELYDLRSDPDEQNNRIDDPALAEVRADLTAKLDAWMRETNDPLLERLDLPYPPEQFQD